MCRIFVLQDVGSDCASDTAHILRREVVRDDAAPAIGAKFNWMVVGHSVTDCYTSLRNFLSSRYFTTFPTSCAWSSVVIKSASSVSTTTSSFIPTAATNFLGASMYLLSAFSVKTPSRGI